MKLDIRKLKVLTAIVETYIETGEPVGSKTVARKLDFQVSSATIRNDMAALFDMGLLEQPHADYTKCATVSTTITPKTVQVKRVEIVPAGARTVVVLVIATNGVIKNKVCRVDFGLTTEIVEFLNQFCNGRLVGKSVSDISQWYINSIAVTLGDYSTLFVPVLATVYELCREINEGQFYTSGSVNLLGYKEFSDIARDLLLTMNNREQLLGVLASKSDAVFITIGKENPQSELADTSVVVTRYKIGEQNSGAIGVIGPVRMDFTRPAPSARFRRRSRRSGRRPPRRRLNRPPPKRARPNSSGSRSIP